MPSHRYNPTADEGVHAVGKIFTGQFRWAFREQPTADFGIDAHIEIVRNGLPTGQLAALQIKSGPSYFQRYDASGIHYYSQNFDHLRYWVNHSLPVFLILYHPESEKAYWQKVELHRVTRTEKGWEIVVPWTNVLDERAATFFEPDMPNDKEAKIRFQFAIDQPIMRRIRDGECLFVKLEDWINKSLNIKNLLFFFDSPYGVEPDFDRNVYLVSTVEEAIVELLPWAEVYELEDDVEEVAGEIEIHTFEVTLTEMAEKYLKVEDFFRGGV